MATANPGKVPPEPRAAALARYLRDWAAAFSLSADTTHASATADAGMALLDAAAIAESMQADDPRIRTLSEAGLFESMPNDEAFFVETPRIRAGIVRPISSDVESGESIIATLVSLAAESRD